MFCELPTSVLVPVTVYVTPSPETNPVPEIIGSDVAVMAVPLYVLDAEADVRVTSLLVIDAVEDEGCDSV